VAPNGKQKTCTACGQTKSTKDFYGKAQQCKRCVLDRQKAAKAAKKAGSVTKPAAPKPSPTPEAPAEKVPANMRRCSMCGEVKPKADYYTGHGRCKPCFAAAAKMTKAAKDAAEDAIRKREAAAQADGSSEPHTAAWSLQDARLALHAGQAGAPRGAHGRSMGGWANALACSASTEAKGPLQAPCLSSRVLSAVAHVTVLAADSLISLLARG
jgi:hypothetical protein